MFIKFNELVIKNFMSVGNNPVVVNLSKSNKTLIKGFNGNGKSVILHALTYALFGRAYAKINLPSLVNSINNKECIVEIKFEIGTDNYKIIRGQKPKIFQIWKNDKLIEQDALNKDYQLYLEEFIIKMNFNSFCQLMALGSMSFVPFLQLKAQERREFVEFILGIQLFSGMNKKLKDAITLNKNTIFNTEIAIDANKKVISNLEDIIQWATNDNTSKLQDISNNIKELLQEYNKLDEDIKSLRESSRLIIVDDSIISACRINIEKCNKIITTKETEAVGIRKKITFLNTNDVCTVCNQQVDTSHKDAHIKEYENELTNLGEILIKVKSKLEDFTDELESLVNKQKEKQSIELKLSQLESKLSGVKIEIKRLHAEKTKLESNDDSLVSEKRNELSNEINILQDNIKTNQQALTLKRVLDIMQIDLKDNGAKSEIIKTYIPIINTLVNNYLQKMNLFVKFQLDENFNETLKSRHRDEFTYESFSQGERCRINFALMFAWRELIKIRTGVDANLLFIDEIMEIGDVMLFETFLELISLEPKTNCFVISHKTGIEQLFDDTMDVTKVKGFTQITQS